MSSQEKDSLLQVSDTISGDIDTLFDVVYPGRVETNRFESGGSISHAVAQADSNQTLFIDRKIYQGIEGEEERQYRVALAGLEEESRRRNALIHTCILVLQTGVLPLLELERVLYPHRKVFKGYNFVKPHVQFGELQRWSGLVASSVLLDEEASEHARKTAYESNIHTFDERISMGGIREKLRSIRRGY